MPAATDRILVLIGMRCSGKTTIGGRLAQRLGCEFVDLDDLTLARLNLKSVTEAWRRYGERTWRQAEVSSLREALASTARVLGLGGGTPMVEAARALLASGRAQGRLRVVYLHAKPSIIATRMRHSAGDRPSLTGDDPADEVERVMTSREPIYRALADFEIDTGAASTDAAVEAIFNWQSQAA